MHRINLSPFLCLLVISFTLIEGSFDPLWILLFSLLHEAGHWIAIRRLGGTVRDFRSRGAGFSLRVNGLSYRAEALAAFSGPAVNLLLAGGFALLAFIHPSAYFSFFAAANLALAAMNLLPVYPLDGGRILASTLGAYTAPHTCRRIVKTVGICFLIPLLALSFRQFLKSGYNISLLVICLTLIGWIAGDAL